MFWFFLVLWWSWLITVMFSKRFVSIKKIKLILKNAKSGKSSFKQFVVCNRCIKSRLCIEILKVQTFSCTTTWRLNSVIWMFQKSRILRDWTTLKPAHHTMLLQKSGRMSHTMSKVMYGVSVVSSMKWWLSNLHSKLRICKDSTKRFWKDNCQRYQNTFHLTCGTFWKSWFKSVQRRDPTATSWWSIPSSERDLKNTFLNSRKNNTKAIFMDRVCCLRPLGFQRISCICQVDCRRRIMRCSSIITTQRREGLVLVELISKMDSTIIILWGGKLSQRINSSSSMKREETPMLLHLEEDLQHQLKETVVETIP